MNDILHPIPENWSPSFMAALTKWEMDAGKISHMSNYSFVDFLKIDMTHQPMDGLIISILKRGNINPSLQISTLKNLEL
jgi:hypothetical protein